MAPGRNKICPCCHDLNKLSRGLLDNATDQTSASYGILHNFIYHICFHGNQNFLWNLFKKNRNKRHHPMNIPAKFGCDLVNGVEGDGV